MTTLTYNDHLEAQAPEPTGGGRVTFVRTVASEWIKMRSVRSTVWTVVATVVLMAGVSALAAWGSTQMDDASPAGMNVAQLLSAGYQLGQLGVAVLGVLLITSEFSLGMARSTFAAVPSRVPVLWAKAAVLTVVVLTSVVVAMALSYVATMPWHAQLGATFDLSDPETLRMTVAVPLYLAAIGLLAMGIGALVRHSAAALTGVIALLLVVENVLTLIPVRAIELVSPFLPSTAGRNLLFDEEMLATIHAATNGPDLSPWQGYAVLMGWVVVLFAVAAVLLRRRDA